MADVENNAWTNEIFWQDGAYQHEQSPIYSYSAQGVRTSLAAAQPYQFCVAGGFASTQSLSNTPRYVSDNTLIQRLHMQEYEHELQYTTAGANHGYRERSGSGTTHSYARIKSATSSPGLAHYQIAADTHHVGTFLSQGESFGETSVAHNDSDLSTFEYTEEETHEDAGHDPDAEEGGSVSKTSGSKERLPCTHAECLGDNGEPKRFFSRKADVTRHYKSRHEVSRLDCPWPKCTRKGVQGFARSDHLTEHRRGYHQERIPKRIVGNSSERPDETTPTSNAGLNIVVQPMSTGVVSASASASLSPSFESTPTTSVAEMSDGNSGQLQTYYQDRDIAGCTSTAARKREASDESFDADQESNAEPTRIGDAPKRRRVSRLSVTAHTNKDMTRWESELSSTDRGSYYQTSQQPQQQTQPRPPSHGHGHSHGQNESMMYGPQPQTQSQTQSQTQHRSGSDMSTSLSSFYLQSHEIERYSQTPRMPPQYFQDQHRSIRNQFR
ncbi:hypothetical protein LTS17_006753 [Exophiala oligosperma]